MENDSFHDIPWKGEMSHVNTHRIFQEEGIAEEALAAAQNKATNLRCKCDTSQVCFYMEFFIHKSHALLPNWGGRANLAM